MTSALPGMLTSVLIHHCLRDVIWAMTSCIIVLKGMADHGTGLIRCTVSGDGRVGVIYYRNWSRISVVFLIFSIAKS